MGWACLIQVGMKRLMPDEVSGLGIGAGYEEEVRFLSIAELRTGADANGASIWLRGLTPSEACAPSAHPPALGDKHRS